MHYVSSSDLSVQIKKIFFCNIKATLPNPGLQGSAVKNQIKTHMK